jgi:hypothetical protein
VNKQPIPSLEIDADFNNLKDMVNNARAAIQNYYEWSDPEVTPTYVAGNQFTVPGDKTVQFAVGRGVKATLVIPAEVYSWVQSVSYGGGITTITLTSSVLTSALSAAWFGLESNKNSLPNNIDAATATTAADSSTVGGFAPSQTPLDANKAVASPGGSSDLRPWLRKIIGVAWIAHGDNVINFPTAMRDGYVVFPQIVQNLTRNKKNPLPYKFGVEWKREGLSQIKVNVKGGYGFTIGGDTPSVVGTTERFDDVANSHTARTAATARWAPAAYSLNGYGFSSGGYVSGESGVTERFDDVANTHTGRTGLTTARHYLAGYSLNGYGFSSGGYVAAVSGVTERFDDVANTHTGRTGLTTARQSLVGYSLNGYGFSSGGYIASHSGITERFDDVANTHTGRTGLTTARADLAGYSFNGMGFTSCGTPIGTSTTERFDDVANNHTARTAATARYGVAGCSVNGYGFSMCGYNGSAYTGTTERFDDVANNHTTRTNATARTNIACFSLNELFISYIAMNIS